MKNKATALRSITRRTLRGSEVFECYLGTDITGRQIRISRSTMPELRAEIDRFYAHYKAVGPAATELSARQVYDALSAFDVLKRIGADVSLTELAEQYAALRPACGRAILVGEAYEEYLRTFNPAIQHKQVRSVKARVGQFVAFLGAKKKLTEIGEDAMGRFLATHGDWAAKTANNTINYCKTFLAWCASKKYLAANPLAECKTRRIAYEEPEFAAVEAVERIARQVEENGDREAMAYLALSFFSGIRFEELTRLSETAERDVLLGEDKLVRISKPKGWTRGIRPRAVQLTDNAAAWLEAAGGGETVDYADWVATRTRVKRMAETFGYMLPHNAGRHSFITYHVAWLGEPSKTEALAGTSASMRANHYMGLASKAQGERYFSIMPQGATNNKGDRQ